MTEQIEKPQECAAPKPPICRLSTLSGLLLLMPFIILVLAWMLAKAAMKIPDSLTYVFLILAASCVIGSILLAITAQIRIALSDGQLRGGIANIFFVIVASIVLFFMAVPSTFMISMKQLICSSNLEGLVTALKVYAQDHNGQLPPADQWCDMLIAEADVSPKSFICPGSDAVEGESCYALNELAAGKALSDLPDGMMLLFETHHRADKERDTPFNERQFVKGMPDMAQSHKVAKNRWNQVGGPDTLYSYHSDGMVIAKVGEYPEYVPFRKEMKLNREALEGLFWDQNHKQYKAEDYVLLSEILKRPKSSMVKFIMPLWIVIAAAGLWVIIFTNVWRYSMFCVCVVVGSAAIGFLCGLWAEELYQGESLQGIGAKVGAILGAWLAPCFIGLLMKYQVKLQRKNMMQLSVALGVATGAICSTLFHLSLILIYREPMGFAFMGLGLPFGILAGLILGAFSGWIVLKFYRVNKTELSDVLA